MKQKIHLTAFAIFVFCLNSMAQKKEIDEKDNSFFKKVTIAQSLATAETEALPAQFSVTWPKHEKASFLINIGVGIDQDFLSSEKLFSSFTGEYHRNSLTDKQQNNIQLGFKGFYIFSTKRKIKYYFTFDPQFSRDFVEEKNSIQTNLLFSFSNKNNGFKLNGEMVNKSKSLYTILSINGGPQMQYVLNSDKNENLRGFKLRPFATLNTGIYFMRNKDISDVYLGISSGFTSRYALVNSTNDEEKDTYQLRSDINYYFHTKPTTKLSIGATYLNGSDPYTALSRQQYFLISFNVFFKGK